MQLLEILAGQAVQVRLCMALQQSVAPGVAALITTQEPAGTAATHLAATSTLKVAAAGVLAAQVLLRRKAGQQEPLQFLAVAVELAPQTAVVTTLAVMVVQILAVAVVVVVVQVTAAVAALVLFSSNIER